MNTKRWTLSSIFIAAGAFCLVALLRLGAASPPSGNIGPASNPVTWTGAGAGGTSNGEGTCVEGVNCDTFTLTVMGDQFAWQGKQIEVTISWVVLASDYDVYIHKGSNSGALVDSSTNSSPGTNEVAHIKGTDLDPSGTSVFTVHVVYFSAAAADQYHGDARVIAGETGPEPPPTVKNWTINYHGQCCEGNLSASGNNTYVLLPVLVQGNKILKSSDGGHTWRETYPPAPVSFPFGIEGDMQAFGNDVIFYGTELGDMIVARSTDQGETWISVQVPVASAGNDQAWSYLGPLANMRPGGALPTDTPYVLAGWMRIGSAVVFSFDGGLTWPIQTPLVGDDGSGPEHVVCQQNAVNEPNPAPGDTRTANPLFANYKGGRHGTWGPDRKFHWAEPAGSTLYTCETADFGLTWTGNKHTIASAPGSDFVVAHSAFDKNGTFYVLHGNKLYVSFNGGQTFAFTHTLPRFGNALRSDSGADQAFAVDCGTAHVALIEDGGNGTGRIYYLRGTRVDTATPTWDEELVDITGNVRLDFMYIVLNGNNIPTISYTTPGSGSTPPLKQVTTASRNAPMPALSGSTCGLISVAAESRKAHGENGFFNTFSIPLPLNGPPGIECRVGGGENLDTHQVVVRFGAPASMSGVLVTAQSGKTAELDGLPSLNAANTELTINLKNVSNGQTLNITLQGVVVGGGAPADVVVPMMIMAADTSDDTVVNIVDTNQTKFRSGHLADATNFRSDVNCDGRINVADANFVKAHAGPVPPAPPQSGRAEVKITR